MTSPSLPVVVVLVAVGVAAVTDLRAFKIYNVLTLPLLVSGLAYHGIVGGADALTNSALGALFGFGVLLLFFLTGGIGGGDVKLLAGIGSWLGVPLTLAIFTAAALAAGVYSLILIVANGRLREAYTNIRLLVHRVLAVGRHLGGEDHVEEQVRRDDRRSRVVPFAAMLALGLVAVLALAWLRPAPSPHTVTAHDSPGGRP